MEDGLRGLLGSLARTGEVALALASWAALAGCVTPPAQSPAGTTANLSALPAQAGAGFSPVAQPKLVVVIVLDQFRADYL
ncbi:MAG: hypothetical protein ACREXM_20820, partial [Gammaproteobacteria bacterium]